MDSQSENNPSPRETYNFIGNDRLVDFLVFSEENNRLHHAYLLSGDKGIGKATFAYNFARYLFNNKKNNFSRINRDNKHSRLIESRSHPDLFVIETDKESKKNKIDVNQVKEIIITLKMEYLFLAVLLTIPFFAVKIWRWNFIINHGCYIIL